MANKESDKTGSNELTPLEEKYAQMRSEGFGPVACGKRLKTSSHYTMEKKKIVQDRIIELRQDRAAASEIGRYDQLTRLNQLYDAWMQRYEINPEEESSLKEALKVLDTINKMNGYYADVKKKGDEDLGSPAISDYLSKNKGETNIASIKNVISLVDKR